MRRLGALAAVVTLLQVSSVGPAGAATKSDIVSTYGGIRCTWQGGDNSQTVCMRSDGKGYAGGIARSFVSVFTVATGRLAFFRDQSLRSPGYGPLTDKRIFHSESHRGITCAWSRLGGGEAICNRTDWYGYVLRVARELVSVANGRSPAVFIRNQPPQ
jgi:hypothetical protein